MKYDSNITSHFGITLVDEFTVRKEARIMSLQSFLWIKALVNHFIKYPDPMVVPVYKFEQKYPRDEDNKWAEYEYAYEMKRLGMLDVDERNIICDYRAEIENSCWEKRPFSLNSTTLLSSSLGTYPKLINFLDVIFSQNRYSDTHSGNFMKDEEGNYLIIDLEGFSPHSLDDPKNDWISR